MLNESDSIWHATVNELAQRGKPWQPKDEQYSPSPVRQLTKDEIDRLQYKSPKQIGADR